MRLQGFANHLGNATNHINETHSQGDCTMCFTSQAKAKQEAGGISSHNSKMPGSSWALPPSHCQTGSKLATIPGSTCFKCYAKKSEAMYPNVRKGWADNYLKATAMIANHPDRWVQAMAYQINHHAKTNAEPFHRWFDAGDLQSVDMLAAIIKVCELTPTIHHWLPTREAKIVADWRKAGGVVPANLVIRISATMVGDKPRNAGNTSTVHHKGQEAFGHACPSSSERHRAANPEKDSKGRGKAFCHDCRACWDSSVSNVSYPLH